MSLPFTEQQCFIVAMLVFVVVGFQRGWRRELVSLVFVLLAFFLARPDSARTFGQFLARIPAVFAYLLGSPAPANTFSPDATATFGGIWGPLLVFILLMALGYYIGNRAFPRPSTPHERFIGVVPAVISGAFILAYLTSVLPKNNGQVTLALESPDPANFIPVIFVIAIIALVVALIAARAKKPPAKK